MKMNNKGLSLVEIIIVVAIMTVMTGLMSFGVGIVASKPADECAQKLTNTLRNARITAMGKLSCDVKLTQAYAGAPIELVVVTDGVAGIPNKIGQKGVEVTYKTSTGDVGNLYSLTSGLSIRFDRSTGGFKTADLSGDESKYISEITISKGTISRVVKLSRLTGRVTIE